MIVDAYLPPNGGVGEVFDLGDVVKFRTGSFNMIVVGVQHSVGAPDQITTIWWQPKNEAYGMATFPDFALRHAETVQ